jgi:hypothetical protein
MENKELKITLQDYNWSCGDGCCDESGTIIKVNDVELYERSDDRDFLLISVLKHLGYNATVTVLSKDGDEMWTV